MESTGLDVLYRVLLQPWDIMLRGMGVYGLQWVKEQVRLQHLRTESIGPHALYQAHSQRLAKRLRGMEVYGLREDSEVGAREWRVRRMESTGLQLACLYFRVRRVTVYTRLHGMEFYGLRSELDPAVLRPLRMGLTGLDVLSAEAG
jgi:hypothetical protein